MKKIPTLYVRDENDRRRVTDQITPGCEWVLAGEGRATRKFDGTCCLVRGGKLFKRRMVWPGEATPPHFEPTGEPVDGSGKLFGWVPVGDGPDDRWHREAFAAATYDAAIADGTYELCGPAVQSNPEGFTVHVLVPHGSETFTDVPRTRDGLRDWLQARPFEGLVFHHPDGRMAKLKRRDFA